MPDHLFGFFVFKVIHKTGREGKGNTFKARGGTKWIKELARKS